MNWTAAFKSALILFAIVNPIGSIPIFLQVTSNMTGGEKRRAFKTGVLSAATILIIFIVAGKQILTHVFQIQLNDLMAAGGLLLLIIAIDHLIFGALARGVLEKKQLKPHHVGAMPIACPILAGPGAMMTVLMTSSEYGFLTAVSSVIIVLGITWLILRYIDVLYRFLGDIVCTVLSKILCLFIAAIGIRLLMLGLSHYFK
jgi:multiple antibiotic resistance protein